MEDHARLKRVAVSFFNMIQLLCKSTSPVSSLRGYDSASVTWKFLVFHFIFKRAQNILSMGTKFMWTWVEGSILQGKGVPWNHVLKLWDHHWQPYHPCLFTSNAFQIFLHHFHNCSLWKVNIFPVILDGTTNEDTFACINSC